jgi:hypothetical protein
MLKDYLSQRLPDPDAVGSSEYRSIREVVMSALDEDMEDKAAIRIARAVCKELSMWVVDVRGHVVDYEWSLKGRWQEDPKFPSSDWRYEVENGDTRLGYQDWLEAQYERI